MPRTRIPAGELLPDQPGHLNPGLVVADGVLPALNGYRPLASPAFVPNGNLGSSPYGAICVRSGGVVHLLAGTASTLARFQAAGWASVASGFSASSTVGWDFALAGGLILATNGADAIRKYTLATGAVATLGGSPPLARYVTVARGRVLLGYVGSVERKIAWSADGDAEDWTATPGGPGSYEFATGGEITGVEGGEIGLVFQESAITRLTPSYGESAWQYDVLSSEVGCIAPRSLHRYGRLYRFLSAQGWMETDGYSAPVPMGKERIDRTFMSLAERAYYSSMSAVTDPNSGLMYVTAPNTDPPSKLFIFDPSLNRWTTATLTIACLFVGLSQSTTLEQLDATYSSLDDMTTSLDDRVFQGGYPSLMFFDGAYNLSAFTGAYLGATFTDAEREFAPGRRTRLRRLRVLSDAAAPTVSISGRDRQSGDVTTTAYSTITSSGEFPVRDNWNLAQVGVTIPAAAEWSYFQGYDLEYEIGSRR